MNILKVSAALALAAALAGCAALTAGYDIKNLRSAQATGDAFTQALTEEYRDLMNFEADEMYDWRDAGHYARKGLRTAAGEVLDPDTVGSRRLPADTVDELTSARAELMGLLNANARSKFPKLAARAQGRYDCWLEQQEENIQPDHIASCRDEFYVALEKLKAAMAPKPMPKAEPAPAPKPQAPEPFTVYFGFDSTTLNAAALAIIDKAVAQAKKFGTVDFSATGHADRAGPAEYNLGLSLRRADAVRDALAARGITSARISVGGRGEAENAVSTADGVREPANRRVEVIILE
jgi:OOP family OmpA-OmpF porin